MSTSSLPAQEPDNQGNQNLHLTDSLLVFGFGSERLTAKSYGSTPFFAAARSFQPMSAAACTGCTEALTPSFRGENCSFYLFEGMGSFSRVPTQQARPGGVAKLGGPAFSVGHGLP